ncbi:KR domain-containing protein [Streptomyces sp. NPDC059697]|uniref:beta-ketoacyl reductase n=1 Tax=Streptomyces sp. NPDC059697 TaxID=3346912 RepID=UPI0036C03983
MMAGTLLTCMDVWASCSRGPLPIVSRHAPDGPAGRYTGPHVPGVADVALVGKPHEVLGEVPVAFLVPDPEGLDLEQLFAACREQMSYYKVPEELYEIEQIPRTASGKVTRHVLLEQPTRLRASSSGRYESLFRIDWTPLPSVRAPRTEPGRWAVAESTDGSGTGVAEGLMAAGVPVDRYEGLDAVRAAVDAGEPVPAVTVLDLTAVPEPSAEDGPAEAAALRELVRQLEPWSADAGLAEARLVVRTRRAVAAGSAEDVEDPIRAPLLGWLRSAQAELPGGPGRLILADIDGEAASVAALPVALSAAEPQFAVRGGVVLLPGLAQVSSVTDREPTSLLDPQRTVVVSGAEGRTGAAVARQLVAGHGARHLLLISPHGRSDPAAATLKAELARAGAKVRLAACDVTDGKALAAVLAKVTRPLTAVVHAAADTANLEQAIAGARRLDELTRNLPLTSFVLISSVTGVLGAPGQGSGPRRRSSSTRSPGAVAPPGCPRSPSPSAPGIRTPPTGRRWASGCSCSPRTRAWPCSAPHTRPTSRTSPRCGPTPRRCGPVPYRPCSEA